MHYINEYKSKFQVIFHIGISFGFVYYVVLPIIVADYFYENNYPFSDLPISYIRNLNIYLYFVFGFFYLSCLFLGFVLFNKMNSDTPVSKVSKTLFRGNKKVKIGNTNTRTLSLFWIVFILLLLVQGLYYYLSRNILFTGYTEIAWNEIDSRKTFLCGLNLLYTILSLYYCVIGSRLKAIALILILLINSIVILGFGARMYVIVPALSYIQLFYIYKNIIPRTYRLIAYSIIVFMPFLFIFIGLARFGQFNFKLNDFIFILLAEPYYTWLSAGSFLTQNTIDLFQFPNFFVTLLLLSVPSIFWPNKRDFIESTIINSSFFVDSPLGATSIVFDSLASFGFLGSIAFFMIFGFFVAFIVLHSRRSAFYLAFTIFFMSTLPFMFFRDGFVLFFKNAFINGFVFAYILAFLMNTRIRLSQF